jgi:biopolymer transport protein ExbD
VLKTRRTSAEPRIEMAPIIDVVFLLLTFFVFSLVLLSRVSVADLDLPAMGAGEQRQGPEAIVVAVDRQGMVFVDGQAVGPASAQGEPLAESTRTALLEAISLASGPGSQPDAQPTPQPGAQPVLQPTIRLEIDERGVSGALLRVLDALRTQGYEAVELVGMPADRPAPAGDP